MKLTLQPRQHYRDLIWWGSKSEEPTAGGHGMADMVDQPLPHAALPQQALRSVGGATGNMRGFAIHQLLDVFKVMK